MTDPDEPKADEECDADYCGHGCQIDEDTPADKGGMWYREIEGANGADVMIYCTCEHHGADILKRVTEHSGHTWYGK